MSFIKKKGRTTGIKRHNSEGFKKIKTIKSRVKYRIENRNHFRIFKAKGGYKYQPTKRIKYVSKELTIGFLRRLSKKSYNLVDLLIRLKIYKQALLLKILFVIIPMIILIITDNIVVAISITTINVFLCTLFFSFCVVDKQEATLNGKFDYGFYKYLKAKKETIVIILTFFTVMMTIIIGHYYFNDVIFMLTNIEI